MEQDITESAYFFKLWAWFDKNKKQVAWGAAGLAAAGAVVGIYLWSQQEKAVAAGQALSSALVARTFSRTESPDAMLKVATTYPGTQAGAQALLLAAGELFAGGKPAEAQAQFERFLREYPTHPLAAQANLGVAACLAGEGKLDEAAKAYKSLVDRFPNANTAPQARFALAGVYEAQGKLEPALRLFEEVAGADISGSLGSEAGMRAHELQMKLGPILTTNSPLPLVIGSVTNVAAPKTN
jgi:predicted negative regulator of RcsB-dependent stress response